MSEQVTIARPYAEAAFSLAREQNALPQWAEMLKIASNVASRTGLRCKSTPLQWNMVICHRRGSR